MDERLVEHLVLGLNEEHPIEVLDQNQSRASSTDLFDMHYELEIGIILKGEMVRFAGNTRRTCRPGDMWFCGMWEAHGYRSDDSCHRIVILVWPPVLAGLRFPELRDVNWMQPFTAPPRRRPLVPGRLRHDVIRLVEHHGVCDARPTPARRRLFLMEVLLFLFEHGLVEQDASDAAPKPERMVRIMPAIDLALGSRDLITNDQAARVCGLTRDIFVRSFHKLMGVSFSKFTVRHRLSRASEQLAKTDMPIKAIAREWGFTDTSHLYRLFKKHYGCTPLAYRVMRAR